MNVNVAAAIGALALGAAAFLIVAPLARLIPMRLQRIWDREVVEHAKGERPPIISTFYEYSSLQISIMCICAMVIGIVVLGKLGVNINSGAQCFFLLGMLLLVTINLKHMLLPDYVVFFLLWCGLLYHATQGQSVDYIYGAIGGYVVPLVILLAVQATTGRSLIGYGDLKTFAAAGSWLGISALPTVFAVFIASIVCVMASQYLGRGSKQTLIGTGPCHFLASFACVLGARII